MTNKGYAVTINNDLDYKDIVFNRIQKLMSTENVHGKVTLDWVYGGVMINLNGKRYAFYDNATQKFKKMVLESKVYTDQFVKTPKIA